MTRTVRLGVKSLMLHKLRSSLTTAGILFGVASVIAMLAVGEGASYEALEKFKDMGTTNVLVRSRKPAATAESASASSWSATVYGLSYKEADQIEATLPEAEYVVRVRETDKNLYRGHFFMSSVVVGTAPEYGEVANLRVDEGRWLSPVDVETFANVCVIGASVSANLFPLEDPIGEDIFTGEEDRFRVVGVLDRKGAPASPSGKSLDESIFIPITVSRQRFGDEMTKRSGGSFERERVELHEVKVKLATSEDVIPAARVLRHMLAPAHDNAGDLEITVPLELLRQEEAEKQLFKVLLGCIAGISLLVGGIGIMNVMLATVTERTREIGIRRALGAKKRHIITQFLVETGVLSALGGFLGVALGLVIPFMITTWLDTTTLVLMQHVILAFSISAFVGVVFGIYPAWRAANMDPVEALRHE